MSAVMEPQGRGHELLQTWALFRRGGERTHSPVTSSRYDEPLDKEHVNEPPFVVEVDRIFAGLHRGGFEHSVDIAKRFYLSAMSIWEVATKTHRTEGFVGLTLRGVCTLVEQRVTE